MKDGAYYVIFKGFHNPMIYHAKDIDIVTLDRGLLLSFLSLANFKILLKLRNSGGARLKTHCLKQSD